MLEDVAELERERAEIRRASVRDHDHKRDVELLQRAVLKSVREAMDWSGEIAFSEASERIDKRAMAGRLAQLNETIGAPNFQTLDLQIHPGIQFVGPQYDRWWAVGSGMPWAHLDGEMFVIGSDGFSASGFGFFLEANENGLVSITPQGACNSSWLSFDDAPRLHSTAGAGVVVYDGADLLVSRQPILWDVRSPKKLTSQHFGGPFSAIATPPAPWSLGTVPVAPVLAPISSGRPLLVWFYHWHMGSGMANAPFLAFVTSKIPLVSVSFGKPEIIQ